MRAALISAAALSGLMAAPALAVDVTIKNFAGIVTISEGTDGLDVDREGSKGDLNYRTSDEVITIDGGLESRELNDVCDDGFNWEFSINGWNSSVERRLKDYPKLSISVPEGASLTIEDSVMSLDASETTLSRATLDLPGCFDVQIGDALDANVSRSGSGDFSAGQVGSLKISKSGSGNIDLHEVGDFTLSQSGAGDVEIDRIGRGASLSMSGSGDVEIGELYGDLKISKSGSGDIDVESGEIGTLVVRKSGSGDVSIEASAVDAELKSSGSGDIDVDRVTGDLSQSSSGSSDITVRNRD